MILSRYPSEVGLQFFLIANSRWPPPENDSIAFYITANCSRSMKFGINVVDTIRNDFA